MTRAAAAVLTVVLPLSALAAGPSAASDPRDAELAAKVEALKPVLEEAGRMKACTDAAMEKRGIDFDASMALLDAMPGASEARANILRLIDEDRLELSADDRAGLQRDPRLHIASLLYQLKASATFDIGETARAMAVQTVYLDRALDSRCAPSHELLNLIGAPSRAD